MKIEERIIRYLTDVNHCPSARGIAMNIGYKRMKLSAWYSVNTRPVSLALQRLKRKGYVEYNNLRDGWSLTSAPSEQA